jgi:site-specific recombinase XerC
MALFLINGLRVCEIVRANVCDLVKRDECWVLRVHGKGNKEADTRIREDTYRVISAYLDARGSVASQEPLFIGTNHRAGQRLTTRAVQYMVKDRLYAIGVCRENVTCHSLRHSAISHLIRAGATLLDTQEFARHSSPSTTLRYIHNGDKIKKHAVLLNPITIQE